MTNSTNTPDPNESKNDDAQWLADHGIPIDDNPLNNLGAEPVQLSRIEQLPRCCFCGQACRADDNGCHEACLSEACNSIDLRPDTSSERVYCDTCDMPMTRRNDIEYGRCYSCRHNPQD